MNRYVSMYLFLLLSPAVFSQEAITHIVTVLPDGSFSPQYLYVRDGDTVQWNFCERTDNIIPVDSIDTDSGMMIKYKAFNPGDPNEFTGPLPIAVSGVFTQSPESPSAGFHIYALGESACEPASFAGNQFLCSTGEDFATMDWTWQQSGITGVNIRMRWNEIHLGPGIFDWSVLDREISKAVENGKMYNLTFKAGGQGTPSWIFNSTITGDYKVKPVTIQLVKDNGNSCYVPWTFGSPADTNYLHHYFEMWKAAATHLKEKNAFYRALAYVKPSGLNEISPENKLPSGCNSICSVVNCNDRAWAEEGKYTPQALYTFYSKQTALLTELFPEKYMSYMLIQNGFPLINNYSEYLEPLTEPLPGPLEQTVTILEKGRLEHGLRFVVQHNGVGPRPQDRNTPLEPCPNEGIHPAVGPFAYAGMGCPNPFVLREGEHGQITAFQTVNATGDALNPVGVSDPVLLESAFRNVWDNSDAIFFEIYEQRFWEAEVGGPVLDPNATGRTIGEWTELLHMRRREMWPDLPDPFPMTHRHVFKYTNEHLGEPQVHYYVNGSKSSVGRVNNNYGVIVTLPSGTSSFGNIYDNIQVGPVQASPNPFRESLSVNYLVETPDIVELQIYNTMGQLIKTLLQQYQQPGKYYISWDGKSESGQQVQTGIYLLKMRASDKSSIVKIIKMQ
jgi:hypothetical protein